MKAAKEHGIAMAEILMARYEFENWEWWAAELNDATEQFHKRFGVYPNLMGGGPELYKKIDEIIQDDLENVVNDKGEHPGPDDVVEIGVFHGIHCRLDFTINETTPFPAFLLIYDEDPQFDGEPEPVEVDGPVVARRYG